MNLIEAIKAVPDYRQARGIRHQLWLILNIVLLGSCTGYWGYKPLAEFTKNHRSLLIELFNLRLDTRFPCASTFRNVMMEMDFQAIASLFNICAQQSLMISTGELFAVDGKSIKSTLIGGSKTCQDFVSIVSVYSHQQGWVVNLDGALPYGITHPTFILEKGVSDIIFLKCGMSNTTKVCLRRLINSTRVAKSVFLGFPQEKHLFKTGGFWLYRRGFNRQRRVLHLTIRFKCCFTLFKQPLRRRSMLRLE